MYQLHGYGTGLSGEFGEVMKAIEACHEAIHAMGCPRIATGMFSFSVSLFQSIAALPCFRKIFESALG